MLGHNFMEEGNTVHLGHLHIKDDNIRNLNGNFPGRYCANVGLPPECFNLDGVEFHGQLSFMKAAYL